MITRRGRINLNKAKLCIGMDAKRAFCNYRGLGSYSRLLIESLDYWYKDEVSLVLFTPKVTLPGLESWPAQNSTPSPVVRCMPSKGYRIFPEIWRGYAQTMEWESLGLNIYHGLSNEIPLGVESSTGSKSGSIKTIVTIHDLIFMRQPELYPWWDRWNYIRKSKYACERADSIIALSEQTKSDLMEFLKVPEAKIKTIYQAVHPRFYKKERMVTQVPLQKTPSRPYFLFVGAFEERKNILRLIKAFAKVKSQLLDHELILVGKGGLLNEIKKTISALSLEQDVRILSQLHSEDLPTYYQGATALLYPSLFEGFGLPIVEALMSETLVMTSIGSCFPESAGPGAFFIDPYQEEPMAQALIEIVNLSLEERLKKITLGLEHCKKFHWKQTSEQLVSHYKTL